MLVKNSQTWLFFSLDSGLKAFFIEENQFPFLPIYVSFLNFPYFHDQNKQKKKIKRLHSFVSIIQLSCNSKKLHVKNLYTRLIICIVCENLHYE